MKKSVNYIIYRNFLKKITDRTYNTFFNRLKGTFLRNVLMIASGTAMAQIIGIIFSPIITRIYGPVAYGILGVFVSLTAIVSVIVSLTYPMAIVLPKEDKEARGLVKLSIIIGFAISIISFIILFLFGENILKVIGMEVLQPYVMLIPLFLIFSSLLQIVEQWIIRKKYFKLKANATVIQAFLLNSIKVIFGIFLPTATVLIFVTVGGQLLSVILLTIGLKIFIFNKKSTQKKESEKKVSLWYLAKLYSDFPKYRSPEMFINGITQSLPVLMLTSFFGPASAGFYILGQRMLSMPAQLIGKAVGDVFYPRIVEGSYKKENITSLVIKATAALAVIGVLPFGMVIIWGPWLFSTVFGPNWVVAGEYARWIAVWSYFVFVNSPSIRTLPVISEQKFQLIFTNISLVIRIGMLFVGAYVIGNDTLAIALYSLAGAVLNIILISLIIMKSRVYDLKNKAFV
ncbi:lipopolysaccharide biosynthesis protein [Planococcus sp. X10-3]|uniref:lipopolysaccharide biosynthesis protein n=1 Tax=Planococcus sp. X10-3 TaxID=3061240 RepID=UPI003BB01A75